MFRFLYSVLLPFLLPFLLYELGTRLSKTERRNRPVKELTATGLITVWLFLSVFSVPDKAPADSIYTPPRFKDGKIIPAHMESKTDAH